MRRIVSDSSISNSITITNQNMQGKFSPFTYQVLFCHNLTFTSFKLISNCCLQGQLCGLFLWFWPKRKKGMILRIKMTLQEWCCKNDAAKMTLQNWRRNVAWRQLLYSVQILYFLCVTPFDYCSENNWMV